MLDFNQRELEWHHFEKLIEDHWHITRMADCNHNKVHLHQIWNLFTANIEKLNKTRYINYMEPIQLMVNNNYQCEQLFCEYSGKEFTKKQSLMWRQETLHRSQCKFECIYCDSTFSSLDSIWRHIKPQHEKILGLGMKRTFPKFQVYSSPEKNLQKT